MSPKAKRDRGARAPRSSRMALVHASGSVARSPFRWSGGLKIETGRTRKSKRGAAGLDFVQLTMKFTKDRCPKTKAGRTTFSARNWLRVGSKKMRADRGQKPMVLGKKGERTFDWQSKENVRITRKILVLEGKWREKGGANPVTSFWPTLDTVGLLLSKIQFIYFLATVL